MPEKQIIGSHTHNIHASITYLGERLVVLEIGMPEEKNRRAYAFKPDQARETARSLLDMADVAEKLEDPRQN
jgi:hypothetical protein